MTESQRDEIAKLEALFAANPDGRIFTHLAEAYRKAGELERARETVERGLERHGEYPSAHVVHGRVLEALGDGAGAERAFRRVLELDGENRVALRGLGELAVGGGREVEALEYYRALLLLDPSDGEVEGVVRALEGRVEAGGGAGGGSASVASVGVGAGDGAGVSASGGAAGGPGADGAEGEGAGAAEAMAGADSGTGFEADAGGGAAPETTEPGAAAPSSGAGAAPEDGPAPMAEPGSELGLEPPLAADAAEIDLGPAHGTADAIDFEPLDLPVADGVAPLDLGGDEPPLAAGVAGLEPAELDTFEPGLVEAPGGAAELAGFEPTRIEDVGAVEPAGPAAEAAAGDGEWTEAAVPGAPGAEDDAIIEPDLAGDAGWAGAGGVPLAADGEVDATGPVDAGAYAEAIDPEPSGYAPAEFEPAGDSGDAAFGAVAEDAADPFGADGPAVTDAVQGPSMPDDPSWPPAAAADPGADEADGSAVLTETMADLYMRQGLYAQAAEVYRELLRARPDDPQLQARLAEAEQAAAYAPAPDALPGLPELPAAEDPWLETAPGAPGVEPEATAEIAGDDASWAVEPAEPAFAPEPAPGAPIAEPSAGPTIGEYLRALLWFDAPAPAEPDAGAGGDLLLLGESEVIEPADAEGGDEYDRLFGGTEETEAADAMSAESVEDSAPARPAGPPMGDDDEDLEMFRAWLQNLKR